MLIGEHTIGDPPGVGDSYLTLTKTYTMDQYVVFTGVEPLDPEGFRYSLNRNSSLYIMNRITDPYDMYYAIGKQDVFKNYSISTSLLKSLTGLSIDVILRPSYESTIPSTSVFDALIKSYAEIFDEIWRQMETMSNALKLEYAQSTDLDLAWGQIYDLPRIINEDDTSYRDRLKTRTTILNSSGTKQNCETIINSIIGSSSTEITSRYPSSVDINFLTVDAMRIAKDKLSTLNILIPQMLAIGISYNIYMPFSDYYMNSVLKGPIYLPYNIFLAISHHNKNNTYEMALQPNLQSLLTYELDNMLLKSNHYNILIDSLLSKSNTISKSIDIAIKKIVLKLLQKDILIHKKNININLLTNSYIKKYDINKSVLIDQIIKYSKRRNYILSMRSVFHNINQYDIDAILRLFKSDINIDMLSKRGFPERYGMLLTLVGA